jgi:hypothetical protein
VVVHPLQQHGVAVVPHLLDHVACRVEAQVLVRVHQPGQQRDVAEVDDVRTVRWCGPAEVDVGDAPTPDEHADPAASPQRGPVEEASAADHRRRMHAHVLR